MTKRKREAQNVKENNFFYNLTNKNKHNERISKINTSNFFINFLDGNLSIFFNQIYNKPTNNKNTKSQKVTVHHHDNRIIETFTVLSNFF